MIKPISVVIPFSRKNDEIHLWVQERSSRDDHYGLLEFPGGKVEEKESPEIAAIREVKEEVGISISKLEYLESFSFGKGLQIFVFLFDDKDRLFSMEGYFSLGKLMAIPDRIRPNNIEILSKLNKYFQEFRL